MTIPCISIQQLDEALYEWAILYGNEEATGDSGDSSITDCLRSAGTSLPGNERLVEIRYRGLHMGTFKSIELVKVSGAVASRIVAEYATLTQNC